jgi:hypothetical protein
LEALSGPEFGSFERDDGGNIRFVSFKERVVIGSEGIMPDDFGVGYIIALLKPESTPEPFPFKRSKSSTSPSSEPTPPEYESPDLYAQLLRMVGGDKGVADRLVEYERQFNPHASLSVLAESAIARIRQDNQ